jgi:hypothetical protein
MDVDLVVPPGPQDVAPQLPAFLVGPGIGALVDRNDELRCVLRKVRSLASVAFIYRLLNKRTRKWYQHNSYTCTSQY